MATQIIATDSFEVEVTLSGAFVPAERETGPTYDCGGTPGSPERMEDVEVTSLAGLRRNGGGWTRVDLLSGLAPEAKQRLLANIADFLGEAAAEALLAEVEEG